MKKFLIPVIISILILGTLGLAEDVFAPPKPPPEKITIQPTRWDSTTESFQITILVHLPKDAPGGYTVETSVDLFKPDGTPIRAKVSTESVPEEGVSEGGNNHSVHKIPIRIPYDPSEDGIEDQLVQVVVTSNLLDLDGNSVDQEIKKSWKKLDVDGITGP